MNNIILVRDGQIAHVKGFASMARGSRSAIDERDLVTPHGVFIPSCTQGMMACDILKHRAHRTLLYTNTMIVRKESFTAGILVDPDGWCSRIEISDSAYVEVFSLGKRGTYVVEGTPGYDEVMRACVDLTTTIEEACEMYGKYITYSKENLVIKPLSHYADLWIKMDKELKLFDTLTGDHKGRPIL